MTLQALIPQAKTRLKESGMTFSDEWFDACIDWIKDENIFASKQVTVENLKVEVEDQWKVADLDEIGAKCLPSNLAAQKCKTIHGTFVLQVNSINDVGESAYSQWKKRKKLENENTNVEATDSTEFKSSWEPTPRRNLFLTMTDGAQQVFGLELVPIPALFLDMKPGVKISLKGPMECRKGVIQLKPINVTVLGGDVESLQETNSVDQELQRRLNGDEQPTQVLQERLIYQRPPSPPRSALTAKRPTPTLSSTQKASTTTWKPPPTQQQRINNLPCATFTSAASMVNSASSSTSRAKNFKPPPSAMVNNYDVEDDPFVDGEDDIFMEIDENALIVEQNAREATTQPVTQVITRTTQPNTRIAQQNTQVVPSTQRKPNPPPPVIDLLDDDDDFDFDFSDFDEAKFTSEPPSKKSKIMPKSPYQYIKVIKDNSNKLAIGQILYVKACVATLVSSIKVENGKWSLLVSLNDGSGFLEAIMTPELLDDIIGFSPTEMKAMKKSTDPKVKNRISNGMASLSSTLVHMNGIFGIKIQRPNPVIASFKNIESSHVVALKERLKVLA